MTVQQNDQWERTLSARPGGISFYTPPRAWVKETNGLLIFEGSDLFIRNQPNAVTSKQKRQA